MLSIKTTLVICLCLVSILTANPLYRTKDVDSVPAKDIQLLHGSEPKIASNTNGKLCSSSDRLCKLRRRTQDFYIWKARPLELILPLHHSAPVFQEFYNAILTQVSEQWSLQTPIPSFWIKQRNLELLFKPVGGPIPVCRGKICLQSALRDIAGRDRHVKYYRLKWRGKKCCRRGSANYQQSVFQSKDSRRGEKNEFEEAWTNPPNLLQASWRNRASLRRGTM